MDSLTAAAQDVIARGMPLAKAARLNGVPRTTLRWRMAAMERELAGQQVISNGHIAACCNGRQKTAYGYRWRYATEGVMPRVA